MLTMPKDHPPEPGMCKSRTGVDAAGWVELSTIKVASVDACGAVSLRDNHFSRASVATTS